MHRRDVLKSTASIGAITSIPSVALAKGNAKKEKNSKRHTQIDIENEVPLRAIVAGARKHPSQNRIAFVTAAFGDGIQLYIAENISRIDDAPNEIYQITENSKTGVYEPRWKHGNRIEYVKDFIRYQRKVPRSYVAFEEKKIEKNVVKNKWGEE